MASAHPTCRSSSSAMKARSVQQTNAQKNTPNRETEGKAEQRQAQHQHSQKQKDKQQKKKGSNNANKNRLHCTPLDASPLLSLPPPSPRHAPCAQSLAPLLFASAACFSTRSCWKGRQTVVHHRLTYRLTTWVVALIYLACDRLRIETIESLKSCGVSQDESFEGLHHRTKVSVAHYGSYQLAVFAAQLPTAERRVGDLSSPCHSCN